MVRYLSIYFKLKITLAVGRHWRHSFVTLSSLSRCLVFNHMSTIIVLVLTSCRWLASYLSWAQLQWWQTFTFLEESISQDPVFVCMHSIIYHRDYDVHVLDRQMPAACICRIVIDIVIPESVCLVFCYSLSPCFSSSRPFQFYQALNSIKRIKIKDAVCLLF